MIGKKIGHFEILEPLGAGGMGEVFRARDSTLRRDVAIKVLPADLADDPDLLARLKREARLLAALNHPNIATIHALEEHEGTNFLVIELIEGESLEQVLARGPLPVREAMALCKQIAAALDAAHGKDIIYRDLKPANVLVTADGRAKVLDFGIATKLELGSDVTETTQGTELTVGGVLIGTPAYMSPEQVRGEAIDKRADNWAFGCLFYELVTGRKAFARETLADTLAAVLQQDPDWGALSRAGAEHLEPLIRRCLQKEPKRRLRDIGDAWLEIGESLGGTTTVAPAASQKRGWAILAVALVGVLVVAGAVWWQTRADRGAPSAASTGPGVGAAMVGHPTVAVLPFQYLGSDEKLEYLSIAVPDEIISVLSRVETLAVRPFASTANYTSVPVDFAEVGAAVRAVSLVTGQYFREGDQLSFRLEAVDVASGRLLWRDGVTVPANDLLTLRRQVAEKVIAGLVPTIAPAAVVSVTATMPENSEAYELFLKSLALRRDPNPNKQAVEMLERAVEFDPGYSRIWTELAYRLYLDAQYGDGGTAVYEREEDAIRRALELDPDLLVPIQVTSLANEGKVGEALRIARMMVYRHPENASTLFARSYARRYASLIDGAIEDCERALALDPTNYHWRSCALNLVVNGDYDRIELFLALDPGSEFVVETTGHWYLSEGDVERAVAVWRDLPDGNAFRAEHELVAAVVAAEGDQVIERAIDAAVARARRNAPSTSATLM